MKKLLNGYKNFLFKKKSLEEIGPNSVKAKLKEGRYVWIDIENPTSTDIEFLKIFNFHPLAIEDTQNEKQRPKIDDYGDYGFIVTHVIESGPTLNSSQLNMFLGKHYLVTIHLRPIKVLNNVIEKCRKNPTILTKGVDFLAYTIFDAVVDEFFPIIEKIEDKIEHIEEKIFHKSQTDILKPLIDIKRNLLAIRKLVWPLRTILFKLTEEAEVKQEFIYIRPVTAIYFRDVYDHVIRLIDIIDVSREIITSSMEGYLSMISNNLNLVMKKLTSIMTILMIPGLIASIYGMNFEYMPELNMPYGYAVILGVMAASAILSYYFFHRKDWI